MSLKAKLEAAAAERGTRYHKLEEWRRALYPWFLENFGELIRDLLCYRVQVNVSRYDDYCVEVVVWPIHCWGIKSQEPYATMRFNKDCSTMGEGTPKVSGQWQRIQSTEHVERFLAKILDRVGVLPVGEAEKSLLVGDDFIAVYKEWLGHSYGGL